MFEKVPVEVIERFNVALKIMWGVVALIMAVQMAGDFWDRCFSFWAFSSPAWVHSGLKWVFGAYVMPLWGMLVFGAIFLGSSYPVLSGRYPVYEPDEYFPLTIISFVVFYFFRFLQNKLYGSNCIKQDFGGIRKVISKGTSKSPVCQQSAIYVVVALILMLASYQVAVEIPVHNYDVRGREEFLELQYKYPTQFNFQRDEHYRKLHEAEHQAKREWGYSAGTALVSSLALVLFTAPLWRWRLERRALIRWGWNRIIFVQSWANVLTGIICLLCKQILDNRGVIYDVSSIGVTAWGLGVWVILSSCMTLFLAAASHTEVKRNAVVWAAFSVIGYMFLAAVIMGLIIGAVLKVL